MTRDVLFKELVKKTEASGHQITFEEMANDPKMPNPNEYAFYFGSFANASAEVWRSVNSACTVITKRPIYRMDKKSAEIASMLTRLPLNRREEIFEKNVELYIKNNGRMPLYRDLMSFGIEKWELDIMRKTGQTAERDIKAAAELKTGKKFLTMKEQNVMNSKKTSKNKKGSTRFDADVVKKEFRAACEKAGHILSSREVDNTAGLPSWHTVDKLIGPWYIWGKEFGLPYGNETKAKIADQKYQELLRKERTETRIERMSS